jgi:transposase InsO family protein
LLLSTASAPHSEHDVTESDLVERNFTARAPNELWLADITEHPTREGKVYCCVVLDLYSRKVVGWAIDRRCEAVLVNDALSMAALTRVTSRVTVIHSDHGVQFTSWAFSENVRRLGLLGSWAPWATATTALRSSRSGAPCRSNCSTASAGAASPSSQPP